MMTVGSIVEHWTHGRGIIIEVEPSFIKVYWDKPIYWPEGEARHAVWTNSEDVTVISEVK
jgi:hypothetical protein